MSKLHKLNISRLLKELDFLKSDLEYKSLLSREMDIDFMKDVDRILNLNPELKELYLKEEVISETNITDTLENIQGDKIKILPSDDIKQIYRQIVKLTHPDKIEDNELNTMYLEATKAYESNSISDILSICNKLDIDYDDSKIDYTVIQKEINEIKSSIKFIESTYTWIWSETESDGNRDKLILSFIKQKIF